MAYEFTIDIITVDIIRFGNKLNLRNITFKWDTRTAEECKHLKLKFIKSESRTWLIKQFQ
jgi:hypothetical protein